MKNMCLIFRFLIVGTIIFTGCTSPKKVAAPKSLYKTEEGKKIAFESYDKALALWNVEYKEEFVQTDYGRSHLFISGNENNESLILIPGLFADATMWYPNVKDLSEHYRVFTLDMLN